MSQSQQFVVANLSELPARLGFRAIGGLALLLHQSGYPATLPNIMTFAERNAYQCIPALEAAALIRGESNITVFDVRDLAAYRQGHVAEAAHLSEDHLPAWFRRLPKEQPVVIYCYQGNASKTFAQMFSDFRFTRVFSVDGGYMPLAAVLAEPFA